MHSSHAPLSERHCWDAAERESECKAVALPRSESETVTQSVMYLMGSVKGRWA